VCASFKDAQRLAPILPPLLLLLLLLLLLILFCLHGAA